MMLNLDYSLGMIAAIAVWLMVTVGLGQKKGVDSRASLVVLGGALLGARLGAMAGALLLSGALLPQDAEGLLLLWIQSGNSSQGALLGGGIALALWAWRGQHPGWTVADIMAVGLCFGGAVAWLVALRHGLVYGEPWLQTAMSRPLPDLHGLVVPRWPVQEVAAIAFLGLGVIFLLLHLRVPRPPGVLALFALWSNHLLLFVLGFFRDDPTLLVGTFRLEQLTALLWLGGAALLLPARWQKKRPR